MKALFLHPKMPGQFLHIATHLAENQDNKVFFLTRPGPDIDLPSVVKIEYSPPKSLDREAHPFLSSYENAVLQGKAALQACLFLKLQGLEPDVIVAHPWWGEGLFIKDIYPETPVLSYAEYCFSGQGLFIMKQESSDSENKKIELDEVLLERKLRNSTIFMNLINSDWILVPTYWQKRLFPSVFYHRMTVLHDSIDTSILKPADDVTLTLESGRSFNKQSEIITYVSPSFELVQGFSMFMRAADEILKRRPNCEIFVLSEDATYYGDPPKPQTPGKSYMELVKKEVSKETNQSRIHFLGSVPFKQYVQMLQISSVHIYITKPFHISRSMLEAMSTGCLVIAPDTPSVKEVIENEKEGFLLNFQLHEEIADKVDEIFNHHDRFQEIRDYARAKIVNEYDLKKILPLYTSLLEDLAAKKIPPPSRQIIQNFNESFV